MSHFVLKPLHTFFFCTYSASFEYIYIFGFYILLVKKVLKLDHMKSFRVFSVVKNRVTSLILFSIFSNLLTSYGVLSEI